MATWIENAPGYLLPGPAYPAVQAACVFNNQLYAGDLHGGGLYQWNGTNAWVQVAPELNGYSSILQLIVFNGNLYGVTETDLLVWNGINAWTVAVTTPHAGTPVGYLVVYNGVLWGPGWPGYYTYSWNGSGGWVLEDSTTKITSFVVFNGNLYTMGDPQPPLWPTYFYQWNGSGWVAVTPSLGGQIFIQGWLVYNGHLYAKLAGGSGQLGIFEWDGANTFNLITADVVAVFNGLISPKDGLQYGLIDFVDIPPNRTISDWDGASPNWVQLLPFPLYNGANDGPQILVLFNNEIYGIGYASNILYAYGPSVTTDAPVSITTTSAALYGTLIDGVGEICTCGFQWGLTIAYGNTTPTSPQTTGDLFSETISGLAPATTYHYRVFATNGAGTAYGNDVIFTTSAVPPPPPTYPNVKMAYPVKRRLT